MFEKRKNFNQAPIPEDNLLSAVERLTTRLIGGQGETYKYGPNGAQLTESMTDYDDARGEVEVAEPDPNAPLIGGVMPNMRYGVVTYQPRTMEESNGLKMQLKRKVGVIDGQRRELTYRIYDTGAVMRSVSGGVQPETRADQNEVASLARQLHPKSIIKVTPPGS